YSRSAAKLSSAVVSRRKRKDHLRSVVDQRGKPDGKPRSQKSSLRGFFPRLLTAADLAMLPSDLPSGPVVYELDNGKLIVMPPPGDIHGAVESNLVAELKHQGDKLGFGKTRSGGVGVILWKTPDRVVGPDAVFISKASLPI